MAVSSAHASVLRVPGEEPRVHRSLALGIDDPTGSPSGRTRGRDTCTNSPERSRSGSLLCVPGSAREPRRRRTTSAHRGAASSHPQAKPCSATEISSGPLEWPEENPGHTWAGKGAPGISRRDPVAPSPAATSTYARRQSLSDDGPTGHTFGTANAPIVTVASPSC
jgi:hypothetical protein